VRVTHRLDRRSNLRIVVMTAEGQRIIGVDLESLNVRVLKKPVDIASVAQVLAEHSSVSAWLPERRVISRPRSRNPSRNLRRR
jgi:hypothetical protein